MPSPFPGMDPYFERAAVWPGFHTNYLVDLQRLIAPQVEPRYVVEVEDRLYLGVDEPHLFGVADAAVAEPASPVGSARPATRAAGTVAAPYTCVIPPAKLVRTRRRWLTIRDKERRTVVTVIELLSPTDKRPGRDRDRFLEKRDRVFDTRASFVEIDLLRGGQRSPMDGRPACDYCVLVSRWRERPSVGLWPWTVRQPMPVVPIPLRRADPSASVSLRAALDNTYDGSRYAGRLYTAPPEPPLAPADAAWAAALVTAAE